MSPLEKDDILIREWDDCNDWGAWIGKAEYETLEGESYTVCQDQDGEEWVE